MHELGVVREAVKTVDAFAKENGIAVVDTIVLEIGELSGIVPDYVRTIYPAVVEDTPYEKTKLRIDVEEGNGVCRRCHKMFNIIKYEGYCPRCNVREADVVSGRGFMVKEILVP